MSYHLKITKPGYEVDTETNLKNFIFTTERGVFGYRSSTTRTASTNSSGLLSTTHNHAFGYVPIPIIQVTTWDGTKLRVPNSHYSAWSPSEKLEEIFYYNIDQSNVYLYAYAHHYEPVMGGSDTNLSGQSYTFEITYFFNEISDEV